MGFQSFDLNFFSFNVFYSRRGPCGLKLSEPGQDRKVAALRTLPLSYEIISGIFFTALSFPSSFLLTFPTFYKAPCCRE